MCAVCMQMPCHPGCPNAPEPKPIYLCRKCGEGIFEGDKYFQDAKSKICEECMNEMSSDEMLDLFGERLITA